ncbi:hypothetical protein EAF04_003398 [Stromatinia cepivora]|nr:hypothetical protein EAF04_003398 [Stromatinia cepivora]
MSSKLIPLIKVMVCLTFWGHVKMLDAVTERARTIYRNDIVLFASLTSRKQPVNSFSDLEHLG